MITRHVDQPRNDLEASGWAHPAPDAWILHFSWPSNPIPANGGRGHWARHAKQVSSVLDQVIWRCTAARIPAQPRIEAQLVWWVGDNRIRDVDNLAPLEKPMFDALVHAGIVPDDNPRYMVKPRGSIRRVDRSDHLVTGPGFTFHIRRIDTDEDDDL